MKISRSWLQNFFEKPLPDAAALAEALTFHAFEIESVEGDILDVKVTPNRGHDCLSHRAIAKELSAVLQMPLNPQNDPFARTLDLSQKTDAVAVSIEDSALCKRYIAGYIRGVKVGPSPSWLSQSLEAIGQKSINNVVDATNLVMFNTGQPLHAFDAAKLIRSGPVWNIAVRPARKGERMEALDEKAYELSPSNLVIADANADVPIGIAGIKGGKPSGITEATTDIILESANFDGVSVRKTSQALKLRTDASARFEQVLSPELAVVGMQQAVDLIIVIAGGTLEGFADVYPAPQEKREVSVSAEKINALLGTQLGEADIASALGRLSLPFVLANKVFTVSPPFERLDLVIAEDVVEEVGRIIGYDNVPSIELSPFPRQPEVNANFYAAERAREELVAEGYSEVYTSVFADKGERAVLNKVDSIRPYLRTNLTDGLTEALKKNMQSKDLLGLSELKLFEIGTVWQGGTEHIMVGTISEKEKASEKTLSATDSMQYEDLPTSNAARFEQFSKYPYIVRDIALWTPAGTEAEQVLEIVRTNAGELLVRSEKFDEYKNEKTGKTSFAFRLVFQSFEKTLTDEEVNTVMKKVSDALAGKGFEIR